MRRIAGFALAGSILAAACSAGPAPAQTGAAATAALLKDDCRRAEDRSTCYDEALREVAATDVRGALDIVQALSDIDPEVARDGHMYVHAVGIAAYDPAQDFAELFQTCTELFHAGCYHGLIQAYFADQGELNAESINGVCARVTAAGADRWTHFQCLHGIGHGLVIHESHDLLKGLAGCDLLDDPWARASCHGGAFMENVTNATHPHHAALTESLADEHAGHDMTTMDHGATATVAETFMAIDPDDPHYPCTVVTAEQKSACYGMQTSVILYLNEYDFGKAAEICDDADWLYRGVCHQSLGRDASGYANRVVNKVRDLCAQDHSVEAPFCYVGAAKAAIDWAGQPEDGLAFCDVVKGDENRVRCYQAVGQQIAILAPDPDRGRALCARTTGREEQACLFGATLLSEMPEFLAPKTTGG